MTKFVISPDVALQLARDGASVSSKHKLFAPTLFRSQTLSLYYGEVRDGRMSEADARQQLDYVRKLDMRLLGDRSLQDHAWKIATRLKWSDTLNAEYIALTQLQADAFVTLDTSLARQVKSVITVAPFKALV